MHIVLEMVISQYNSQIEQAQTVEELNKIVFKFEMKDFSEK